MATDSDTARSHYENYRFCYENGHERWATIARQCFEFWRGRQWDIQTAARLGREGRPALTFNVIESLVRSMKGIQRPLRSVPARDVVGCADHGRGVAAYTAGDSARVPGN